MENKYFTAAVATDDGKNFINRHFGDARFYDLYQISCEKVEFLKRIVNPPLEENGHADPAKAGSVSSLLKNDNTELTLSRNYGPNLKRINKQFCCVSEKEKTVSEALDCLSEDFESYMAEIQKRRVQK